MSASELERLVREALFEREQQEREALLPVENHFLECWARYQLHNPPEDRPPEKKFVSQACEFKNAYAKEFPQLYAQLAKSREPRVHAIMSSSYHIRRYKSASGEWI